MVERFLSQRQFAKMASISPATLQKLIANKEIRVDPATGKISSLEYQNILVNELKAYKSKNVLVIGVVSDESEKDLAHTLALKVTEDYSQKYFPSLASVYDTITGETITSDAKADVIQYEYNKHILKEFSIRYKNMVKTYKMSVLDNRKSSAQDSSEFYKLPYFITDELFMYGRVVSPLSDEETVKVNEQIAGVEHMNQDAQQVLNTKFDALMHELNLVIHGENIFTRDNLTPEFFEQKGELYDIFFKSSSRGSLATKIPINKEMCEELIEKYNNTHSKSNIHKLLSEGFIIDCFIDLSSISASWTAVSTLLYSGIFANVIILATEDKYNECVPDYIKQAVTVAKATAKFSVDFM